MNKKNLLYGDACSSRICAANEDAPWRSPYRRDYARLIHSPAFRRLQGKTQLFPGHESDFFRNRLTHSLEVAQIAKGIAERLNHVDSFLGENPIDCDLVEFAALAHDLGHPPFGHNGEKALDSCMTSWGGFEGNAQTLRILSVLEKKSTNDGGFHGILQNGEDHRIGINPTMRSLAAILKYDKKIPHSRNDSDPLVKGYYYSEAGLVKRIRDAVAPELPPETPLKTLECQIMDLADDIAYSTYDLEDGLKGGFIDPLMLLSVAQSNPDLLDRVTVKVCKECPGTNRDEVLAAIAGAFSVDIEGRPLYVQPGEEITPLAGYKTSRLLATHGYSRISLTSSLVNAAICSISVTINNEMPALSEVSMTPEIKLQVEALKHLNYEVTIMSPRLKLVEYRGLEIVQEIFRALTETAGHLLLPQDFKQSYELLRTAEEKKRLVCDFVAGMTDKYAVEFFGRLKQGDQSIFKPF
jgi:dGTPase